MAYGYWRHGRQDREAVFHLFFREPPFAGGFTVAAGLATVTEFLDRLHFERDDIRWLGVMGAKLDVDIFILDEAKTKAKQA